MGAAGSLSPFGPKPLPGSPPSKRRGSVAVDAARIRSALREAGETEDSIEALSERLGDYLHRQGSADLVDDATLYSLGVAKPAVRIRLLRQLAGVSGPLRYRGEEEEGERRRGRRPSRSAEAKDGGKEEDDYYAGGRGGYAKEEDGQEDHYTDDFDPPTEEEEEELEHPITTTAASPASPLGGAPWADAQHKVDVGTITAATAEYKALAPIRPALVIATRGAGVVAVATPSSNVAAATATVGGISAPTSPAPSIGGSVSSSGSSVSSADTRTTRSTPLASPPHPVDSRGPTPVTSPANPTSTRSSGGGGRGLLSPPSNAGGGKKGGVVASAASRKTAEALNQRLREDRQLQQSPASERKGSTISGRVRPGHWKLGNKIGKGSFGQVYVGLNEDTGHFIAVKALPIGAKETDANSLYQEIELMRKLEHPNIVRYLGAQVDVTGGKLFIFQEWMAGGSVSSMIEKFGPLKPPAIRKYTIQLLHGLEYLHNHHIIHRDIKGGNLLVDDKGTVKLADFGASKDLGMNGSADALSQTLKGTPYFMAPEVLMDSHYGRKSDIWSVGGAVLQMLTGEPPWKGMNFISAVSLMYHISHSEGPPPMPEEDAPPLLLAFMLRCFERDSNTRPSAHDLLSDPFLTQEEEEEEDEEEEEGEGQGGDGDDDGGGEGSAVIGSEGTETMRRDTTGDYSPVDGEMSDWGQRRDGGGKGEGDKDATVVRRRVKREEEEEEEEEDEEEEEEGEEEEEEETFEFLERAIKQRDGGRGKENQKKGGGGGGGRTAPGSKKAGGRDRVTSSSIDGGLVGGGGGGGGQSSVGALAPVRGGTRRRAPSPHDDVLALSPQHGSHRTSLDQQPKSGGSRAGSVSSASSSSPPPPSSLLHHAINRLTSKDFKEDDDGAGDDDDGGSRRHSTGASRHHHAMHRSKTRSDDTGYASGEAHHGRHSSDTEIRSLGLGGLASMALARTLRASSQLGGDAGIMGGNPLLRSQQARHDGDREEGGGAGQGERRGVSSSPSRSPPPQPGSSPLAPLSVGSSTARTRSLTSSPPPLQAEVKGVSRETARSLSPPALDLDRQSGAGSTAAGAGRPLPAKLFPFSPVEGGARTGVLSSMGRSSAGSNNSSSNRQGDCGYKPGEVEMATEVGGELEAAPSLASAGSSGTGSSLRPGGDRRSRARSQNDVVGTTARVTARDEAEGGGEWKNLPPLGSDTERSRTRKIMSSQSDKGIIGRYDDKLNASTDQFQVHRVIQSHDLDSSWGSSSPTVFTERAVIKAAISNSGSGVNLPAGCLDSHSTSVLLEAVSAPSSAATPSSSSSSSPPPPQATTATTPTVTPRKGSRSLASETEEPSKEQEWLCAKASCGRLNVEGTDHCAFCATIRGSSGARGEATSVYMRTPTSTGSSRGRTSSWNRGGGGGGSGAGGRAF